jgi:hypothetical protein
MVIEAGSKNTFRAACVFISQSVVIEMLAALSFSSRKFISVAAVFRRATRPEGAVRGSNVRRREADAPVIRHMGNTPSAAHCCFQKCLNVISFCDMRPEAVTNDQPSDVDATVARHTCWRRGHFHSGKRGPPDRVVTLYGNQAGPVTYRTVLRWLKRS